MMQEEQLQIVIPTIAILKIAPTHFLNSRHKHIQFLPRKFDNAPAGTITGGSFILTMSGAVEAADCSCISHSVAYRRIHIC